MRKKRGELASRFAAGTGYESNKLAVETRFTNKKTSRNRDTHPAILQDIDGEACAAGSEFAVDSQIIVNACERGFDGRRFWVALDGISPGVKGSVFFDRQDDPAG
jgi:hypothetical protein